MAPFRAVISASLIGFAAHLFGPAYAQGLGLPPNAREGACFIRNTTPALIETVTEQVQVRPEKRKIDPKTGRQVVISPAVYRTKTHQKIVRDRKEEWLEIICVKDLTVGFVKSLQRAMAARNQYRGPITGVMDDRTKRAIRKIQNRQGINSTDLTADLAESYGLIIHRVFKQ